MNRAASNNWQAFHLWQPSNTSLLSSVPSLLKFSAHANRGTGMAESPSWATSQARNPLREASGSPERRWGGELRLRVGFLSRPDGVRQVVEVAARRPLRSVTGERGGRRRRQRRRGAARRQAQDIQDRQLRPRRLRAVQVPRHGREGEELVRPGNLLTVVVEGKGCVFFRLEVRGARGFWGSRRVLSSLVRIWSDYDWIVQNFLLVYIALGLG